METVDGRERTYLPFGIREIDQRLPGGGLALGSLHEVAGGGSGAIDGAAAAGFCAGIAARTGGQVLWCLTRLDLFPPGIAQAGLPPERLIRVRVDDEKSVLLAFEEGLRHGSLTAVVAEVAKLDMTTSRRLQLAAESTGTLALALRRWRRETEAGDFGQPTAARTKWRVSEVMPEALSVPGVARARWALELLRVQGANCADFIVDACDEQGFIALPSVLADRTAAPDVGIWGARA
nr:damage-inducible protein [Asticcacaulis machinosus]